jgi:hypothetical protein
MPTNLTGSTIATTYDQLLHVNDGPEAAEKIVYSGTGVATALKVGTLSVSVDNIKIDGNTISSTDTNGNIVLTPNGTGEVVTDNLAISGNTISSTDVNGNIVLAPNGTGTVNIDKANITGGTITGAVSFAGGSFTGITLISATTITGTTTTNGGNLRMTGNTLSSTDTNGNITISPNGTGKFLITKPFGYSGSGTGGAVTQITSRTTSVTLNKVCGQITLVAGSIAGLSTQEFSLANSFIEATDIVLVSFSSGLTAAQYDVTVTQIDSGSCKIAIHNVNNTATPTDTPVISFIVIKAVNA